MNTKVISIIVGLLLVVGVGAVVVSQRPEDRKPGGSTGTSAGSESINTGWRGDDEGESEDGGQATQPATNPTPTGSTGTNITLADVAKHPDRNSCWSAINGGVYDLTSWIPQHPGGEQNILILCGRDGSSAFNNQHGGSSRIASILSGFRIGRLTQ